MLTEPGTRMSRLTLKGISKSYGGVHALNTVDFEIHSGEVVCLAGENGAGKSTLAKVIGGSVLPDHGEIVLDGEPLSLSSPRDAYEAGIHVVPQELFLVPELSVAENISLGRLPEGTLRLVDRRRTREIARERLRELQLDHIDVTRLAGELPVVDRAFIQVARAISPSTRFLVADEPTAPMSGDESDRLIDLLTSIRAAGVGIVFISHRLDEVIRLADRVSILRDGRNALAGEMKDLTRGDLVRAMVGSDVDLGSTADGEGPAGDLEQRLAVEELSTGGVVDVSFGVAAGEVVGVYGSTGSGREDLGPGLFGARAAQGRIVVDGQEVSIRVPHDAIDVGIGYVPAERRAQGLLLEQSVRDNMMLAGGARFTRHGFVLRRREHDEVEHWIDRLDLKAASQDIPVGTLSGGTQQKVLLARWLLMRQPILVLDEPTRGVDIGTKAQIYRILRDVAESGTAVLVISSDAEELSLATHRVLVMRDGRFVAHLRAPTQEQILTAAHERLTTPSGGRKEN